MKKVYIVLLCLLVIVTVAGCAAKPIEIDTAAQNYLEWLNIENSSITKVDYKAIERYMPVDHEIKYSEISARIDEVLESYYTKELDKSSTIKKGDAILVNIEIRNEENELRYSEKNTVIVVGANHFDRLIEEKFIELKSGDEITVPVSSLSKKYYQIYEEDTLVVNIASILRYVEGSETKALLSEQGFPSFFEFYHYLFKIKSEEIDFEEYTEDKNSFFEDAFEKCQFNISENDLKKLSLQIANEYKQTAESFNMSIEEYYTSLLNLDRDGFFLICTESAERQIKSVLVIGALAQYENIVIPKNALDEFFRDNRIENIDEQTHIIAKYSCLETEVLKQILFSDN